MGGLSGSWISIQSDSECLIVAIATCETKVSTSIVGRKRPREFVVGFRDTCDLSPLHSAEQRSRLCNCIWSSADPLKCDTRNIHLSCGLSFLCLSLIVSTKWLTRHLQTHPKKLVVVFRSRNLRRQIKKNFMFSMYFHPNLSWFWICFPLVLDGAAGVLPMPKNSLFSGIKGTSKRTWCFVERSLFPETIPVCNAKSSFLPPCYSHRALSARTTMELLHTVRNLASGIVSTFTYHEMSFFCAIIIYPCSIR